MRELLLLGVTGAFLSWVQWGAAQGSSPASFRGFDELKNAMYNLGRLFHDHADKLERHEKSERQLGEVLKKNISSMDKRTRTMERQLTNMARNLEERLQAIESTLQGDESEGTQLGKLADSVEKMQKSMDDWQKKMEEFFIEQNSVGSVEAKLIDRLDQISLTVSRLEARTVSDKTRLTETENLKIASTNLLSADSKWRASVDDAERMLYKYQARLAELMATPTPAGPSEMNDWHAVFLAALESHEGILKDLRNFAENTSKSLTELPTRDDVVTLSNSTAEKLEEMRYELVSGTDKAVSKLDRAIDGAQGNVLKGQEEILKVIAENGAAAEERHEGIRYSYEQLEKEMQDLSSIEKVLFQTADNVMDTKRRIDYGVHRILLEVGDLVKIQAKSLNETVNRRFDNISSTILDNQTGALTNLSSKIEHEISQVWRQIGIMYQQLTASASALDNLQKQTESYVNGSAITMDSMEGKVSQITTRMNEFDESLNHLLGRLSLFTHEFNHVKTGLGEALDNIRNSFISVKEKIKEVGPGPNPIPEDHTPDPELLPFEGTHVPVE